MRLIDPAEVSSKSDLRDFAIGVLTKWTAALNRNRLRLHLPRRRGLMRPIPTMPFHLFPEIFLQISGYTQFDFPEESCRLAPGEFCLVSRGLPHREKVGSWKGPFFNCVLTYLPDRIQFHLARQDDGGRPAVAFSIGVDTADGAHLTDLLKDAADWAQEDDSAHRYAIKGSLLANLSIVLAAIRRPPTDAPEPHKVMQVRHLLMQHLGRPELSVNWIGRSLRSNPDYLSRLFRQTTGKSLASYITERRMAHARDLLVSSALNISEISHATGYKDASYFTRVFQKETGLAPRRYRERALKRSEENAAEPRST